MAKTPPDLVIAGIWQAVDLVRRFPGTYRAVSISSTYPMPSGNGNYCLPKKFAQEILYLQFDDITEETQELLFGACPDLQLATVDQCQKAIDFLSQGGKCLVHCRAGVSRSTAIALGALLPHYPDFYQAVDALFAIRSCASPNNYVLRLICDILGISADYPLIIEYIYDKSMQKAEGTSDKIDRILDHF